MPGVRIDRFLTSTAVVLLLCGAAGGALAEPKFGLNLDATTTQPTVTPTSGATEQPAAKPVEPTFRTRNSGPGGQTASVGGASDNGCAGETGCIERRRRDDRTTGRYRKAR